MKKQSDNPFVMPIDDACLLGLHTPSASHASFGLCVGTGNTIEVQAHHSILIGHGLTATKPYQLLVGNKEVSISRWMTDAEFDELRSALLGEPAIRPAKETLEEGFASARVRLHKRIEEMAENAKLEINTATHSAKINLGLPLDFGYARGLHTVVSGSQNFCEGFIRPEPKK